MNFFLVQVCKVCIHMENMPEVRWYHTTSVTLSGVWRRPYDSYCTLIVESVTSQRLHLPRRIITVLTTVILQSISQLLSAPPVPSFGLHLDLQTIQHLTGAIFPPNRILPKQNPSGSRSASCSPSSFHRPVIKMRAVYQGYFSSMVEEKIKKKP